MRADIIKIGNSKGLRIPKAVLEQCGLRTIVNLKVEDHSLVITPYEELRQGWGKGFQLMAQNNDDALIDADSFGHSWDEEEWLW